MSDDQFKLPENSYDELVKIIRAYHALKKESSLEDVAGLATMHKTMVSRNNAFLISMGIISEGQKKGLTELGNELALALSHEATEFTQPKWFAIVEKSEFLQKILSAIRIRKTMEESILQAHIVYSAGQPKTSRFLTGAGTIIEILKQADVIVEQDGQISVKDNLELEQKKTVVNPKGPFVLTPEPIIKKSREPFGINIQLTISCDPSALENLAPKVKAFLKEMSEEQDENTEDSRE